MSKTEFNQPLDKNAYPVPVMMPKEQLSGSTIQIETDGIYRVLSKSEANLSVTYPNENSACVVPFVSGTIEYFFFPKGASLTVVEGIIINKMK